MKKKVAIIGVTGMLGSGVYDVLNNKFNLLLTYRNKSKLIKLFKTYGQLSKNKVLELDLEQIYNEFYSNLDNHTTNKKIKKLLSVLEDCDTVINCTGIIKPFAQKNPALTFFVNSAFPNILSQHLNSKLMHITTDCVFDGVSNPPFNENAQKKPNDIYGLTKSIGEPKESLIIRTSFIGPELSTNYSFLEWVRGSKGKTINGFVNHYWNGVTSKEFGNICHKIISDRKKYPMSGIFHIFSDTVSKYEMILALNKKYNLNITVKKKEVNLIDRRLSTIYKLNKDLRIPSFQKMIEAL